MLSLKRLLNRFGYDVRYHRPFYETVVAPLGIRTILDIGANEGRYAEEMLARFPAAHIHSFEPLASCYARLAALSKREPRIAAHHFALGATQHETDIEHNAFHPSSSLLSMSKLHKALYPKARTTTKERVRVQRLDDIAPSLKLEEPILVKIDVQGFEREVIRGGSATLARASVIVVETSFLPLYENAPLFHEVVAELAALNFTYLGPKEIHHSARTKRPMYEDAIFISPSTRERFVADEIVD
jgi:FkbM family methyltransferase